MAALPALFDPLDLPASLFFYKELAPDHYSFIHANRFLDVVSSAAQAPQAPCWVCIEVLEDGAAGVELAQADTAQAALKSALQRLAPEGA